MECEMFKEGLEWMFLLSILLIAIGQIAIDISFFYLIRQLNLIGRRLKAVSIFISKQSFGGGSMRIKM